MTKNRRLLEQLVKSWAQDHTDAYVIADLNPGEEALKSTQGYLTWVVKEGHASIDLLSLLDRLEVFVENRRNPKHPDGMYCKKCQVFYQYAESNQDDGSMICYSCRNPCG